MDQVSPSVAAQTYNAALAHPTVGVAMRHLARKARYFRASELIARLSSLKSFPEVSVANLIAAARDAGQPLRGLALEFAEIGSLPLPALAYLRRSPEPGARVDLIQIERVGPVNILVSSDRFGKARMPRAEFEQRWAGIALLADPELGPDCERSSELENYRNEVRVIESLLSRNECRELIDYCEAACFSRSRVAKREGVGHKDVIATAIRSSSSVVLENRDHPVLARLYRKCAAREGVELHHVEHRRLHTKVKPELWSRIDAAMAHRPRRIGDLLQETERFGATFPTILALICSRKLQADIARGVTEDTTVHPAGTVTFPRLIPFTSPLEGRS